MPIPRQRIFLPPAASRRAALGLVRGDLGQGEAVLRFERAFAEAIGVGDAVAVGSGRAGLHLLLRSLDLEPGSEVICSAFGYPVVPYLVKSMGFELRFADCELGTLGMDPAALEAALGPNTRAVIATHLYGVPCRIDEIARSCTARGVALIEDCAHCFGAAVGGRKAGSFGVGAYFSFETSKPINTMGGGMITTTDPALAARLREGARSGTPQGLGWLAGRLARTTFERLVTSPGLFDLGVWPALRLAAGRADGSERFASGYHGDEVTLDGRMGRYTDYQARLGLLQMERAARAMERRRANAERLIAALRGHVPMQEPAGPEVVANWMLVSARFADMPRVARELLRKGIDTKHHYMRDCSGLHDTGASFPAAARAEREVLHLPAHPELSPAAIDRVAAAVLEVLAAERVPARSPAAVGGSADEGRGAGAP